MGRCRESRWESDRRMRLIIYGSEVGRRFGRVTKYGEGTGEEKWRITG